MAMAASVDESDRSTALRQQLKEWEQTFAAANGGRKAGRADIKKDPAIAAKYKEYTRLRDIASGRLGQPASVQKRIAPANDASCQTPQKRRKHIAASTPSRISPSHPSAVDPYDAPFAVRALNLTPLRTCIGPTPQKDGQVLGLFDLLSDGDDKPTSTPSRGQSVGTPRRVRTGDEISPAHRIHQRTPASSGKRFLLDSFLTPSHRQMTSSTTPQAISKLEFNTPSFLKRAPLTRHTYNLNLGPIGEDFDTLSPVKIRLPPKPPTRGLSSMLARLRQAEDDTLDDETDVLRELENEAGGKAEQAEKGEKEAAQGRAWKKKGQKRTTKRLTMRPVVRRPPPKPTPAVAAPEADDDADAYPSDIDPSPAQGIESHHNPTDRLPLSLTHPSRSPSPTASDSDDIDPAVLAKDAALVACEMSKLSGLPPTDPKGKVKRAARKIKDSAHANFRRLKIRGSKGAKGGGGKFGRRR